MYRIYRDTPIKNAELFNFEVYTDAISKIILFKENKTPFSIAINGKWGSGKTSLMKTLREKLKIESGKGNNRKVRTVWFDAWKYSETDSMLAALVREILEEMGREGYIDKFKAKLLGGKEINIMKELSDLAKVLTLGQGPEFEKWFEEPLYKEKMSFYDHFQDYMDKILLSFVLEKEEGEYTDKEGIIVIFIDDLDRCPPKEITKVLESINLFLDKEGCFFVFGVDISIISKAIDVEYKDLNVSGNDYIKKMIQLQFDLPVIQETDIKKFMEYELKIGEPLKTYFDIISKGLESNQREIKRFLNSLNLMRILGESIENLDYREELLIKWNILNFSSEYFIKEVKLKNRLLIEMQSLSKKENKDEVGTFIEKLDDKHIEELINKFKNNEKILNVLRSGEEEFNEPEISNYIFLSSVAPKGPDEIKELKPKEYFFRGYQIKPEAKLMKADLQESELQRANLQGADLQQSILKKANLQGANLQGADLQQADLNGANLQNANLNKAKLMETKIGEVNLQGAKLIEADLRGIDLCGANLQEANLQKANLQGAKLQGVNLKGANLQEANLKETNFQEANLNESNLQKVDLQESSLIKANLINVNLNYADLRGTKLQEIRIRKSTLQGANLQGANLNRSNIIQSNLQEINFKNAQIMHSNFQEVNLTGANLTRVEFQDAKLIEVNLQESDLQEANFNEATLINVEMHRSNLERAKFHKARLQGVKLQGANLKGTEFQRADMQKNDLNGIYLQESILKEIYLQGTELPGIYLRGAELEGANLQEANLQEANLQETNLRAANLQGANLQKVTLHKANLQETNLFETDLQGANLFYANLKGANLQRANLREANLEATNFEDANLENAYFQDAIFNEECLKSILKSNKWRHALIDSNIRRKLLRM